MERQLTVASECRVGTRLTKRFTDAVWTLRRIPTQHLTSPFGGRGRFFFIDFKRIDGPSRNFTCSAGARLRVQGGHHREILHVVRELFFIALTQFSRHLGSGGYPKHPRGYPLAPGVAFWLIVDGFGWPRGIILETLWSTSADF